MKTITEFKAEALACVAEVDACLADLVKIQTEVRTVLLARYEDDPTDGEEDTSLLAVARHVAEDWAADMAALHDAEEAAEEAGAEGLSSPTAAIEHLAKERDAAQARIAGLERDLSEAVKAGEEEAELRRRAERERDEARARVAHLEKLQAEERVEVDRELVEILGEWAGITDEGTNEDVECLVAAYEAQVASAKETDNILRAALGMRTFEEASVAVAAAERDGSPYPEDTGLDTRKLAERVRTRVAELEREREEGRARVAHLEKLSAEAKQLTARLRLDEPGRAEALWGRLLELVEDQAPDLTEQPVDIAASEWFAEGEGREG